MTARDVPGWGFLVARGYQAGYQLLLAPEIINTGSDSGLLLGGIQDEVAETAPPRTTVVRLADGPTAVVYRTERLTRAALGETDQADAPLLDRAGRPLVLAYGFVCRNVKVVSPDAHDLDVARNQAIATYRRFHASEEDFLPEVSHSYPLRSRVAPLAPEPSPKQDSRLPAAWTADAMPSRRQLVPPAPSGRVGMAVGAVLAVLVVIGIVAVYLAARGEVEVPDVVEMSQPEAERAIRDAGLVVGEVNEETDNRASGTVIRTEPKAGQRVNRASRIQLWISTGPAPTRLRFSSAGFKGRPRTGRHTAWTLECLGVGR